MRKPLLDSLGRDRVGTSRPAFIAAPTQGWNTRDSLAAMGPLFAPKLDNWFPRPSQLELRGGYTPWSTGLSGVIRTIWSYQPASGTEQLYAATDNGIYNVSLSGPVGGVEQACTNGEWNWVLITNTAGQTRWWGANGTDSVLAYDGTTWSNPAITGVTSSTLIVPTLFKHRIFCTQKDSMTVFFFDIDAFQGAASQLPLGNLFHRGGAIYSIGTWTLDAGEGPDDLLVVITTMGELAVFQGLSPTSADTWKVVGVWYVGRPLGRRCFFKIGADVCVMVESGVYMLSRLLQSGVVNFKTALTNMIQPTVTGTMQIVSTVAQGWKGVIYPLFDAMLVNVPGEQTQWVMNTVTGALCSFSGWAATELYVYQGILYFGDASGNVNKAWEGNLVSDNGADIVSTCHCAYSDFGRPTEMKQNVLFRPLLSFDGPIELSYGMSVDYVDTVLDNTILRSGSNPGTLWDVSPWNTSSWAATLVRQNLWRTVDHFPGYALALWLQTASNASKLFWSGTNYVLAQGHIL